MTSIHGPTDLDTAKKAETERDTERRRAEIAESARFRSDERAEKAEADAHDKAQALAALQLAVLALPVGSGGAACPDDYVRIASDAKARIEELTARADKAEADRDALHTGIRDWLTTNSVLAFDDETPADVLVRHLNITATGYRERAERAENGFEAVDAQMRGYRARAENLRSELEDITGLDAAERKPDDAELLTELRDMKRALTHQCPSCEPMTEAICWCGHPESAHDAGECWTAPDNHDHPTPKCECSRYAPIGGGGDA